MRVTIACLIAIGYATTCAAETLLLRVLDRQTAAPIPQAIVVLTNGLPMVRTILTDQQGEVRIETSEGERLSMSVRSPRHGTRCLSADAADTAGVISITLEPSVQIRGRVVDAQANGLGAATVTAVYQEDPSCRFHIVPQPSRVMPNGDYVLDDVDMSRPFGIVFDAPGFVRTVILPADVAQAPRAVERSRRGVLRESREITVTLTLVASSQR